MNRILEATKGCTNLYVASHFFSEIQMALLSNLFFQANIHACATFATDEALQGKRFSEFLRKKYHLDFHTPIVVNETKVNKLNSIRILKNFIKEKKGAIYLFSDVRFSSARGDVKFRVGHGTFFANRAVKYCLEKFYEIDNVIIIYTKYCQGRFRFIVSEPMSSEQALLSYYAQILPS